VEIDVMRPPTYGSIFCVLLLSIGAAMAQDGRVGVRYSSWEAQNGKSCTVAINVIDADNFRNYVFGFTGNALAVHSPGGPLAAATLQIDGGQRATLTCSALLCFAGGEKRDRLFAEMRRGWTAKLDLRLAGGAEAGPYDVPLAGFDPALKACGIEPLPPPDPRFLNPEPQVAPAPRDR
jgi:hypothetical protein